MTLQRAFKCHHQPFEKHDQSSVGSDSIQLAQRHPHLPDSSDLLIGVPCSASYLPSPFASITPSPYKMPDILSRSVFDFLAVLLPGTTAKEAQYKANQVGKER